MGRAPASISLGTVPGEAMSNASINETIPAVDNTPKGRTQRTDGPRIDEATGTYLPAEYEQPMTVVNAKGDEVTYQIIRQDR